MTAAKVAKPPTPAAARSLIEFAQAKRLAEQKANCAVCRLPDGIRAQVKTASDKKINRRIVREWLLTEHGADITDSDFQGHTAGHHE